MGKHFHVYASPAEGPIRQFSTRSGDTFATRQAAHAWASKQRSPERRVIRACSGGIGCPAMAVPEHGQRLPLPTPRPKRPRRSARLVRLRRRLDQLGPRLLADLEAWLDGTTAA